MHAASAIALPDEPPSGLDSALATVYPGREPLGPVRLPPDPFSLMDVATDATRPTEMSYELARSLAICVGETGLLDAHLISLAVAPQQNLQTFAQSRGTIFFAETFLQAVCSDEANFRRGGPVDPAVRHRYADFDRAGERIFGVYDPQMHSLIFTPQATPANHERVTLHELGHALTLRAAYRVAHLRSDLLRGVPWEIGMVLAAYPQGHDREAVRERVLEVLAEAYVWTVVGRWRELPMPLFDALYAILGGAILST